MYARYIMFDFPHPGIISCFLYHISSAAVVTPVRRCCGGDGWCWFLRGVQYYYQPPAVLTVFSSNEENTNKKVSRISETPDTTGTADGFVYL